MDKVEKTHWENYQTVKDFISGLIQENEGLCARVADLQEQNTLLNKTIDGLSDRIRILLLPRTKQMSQIEIERRLQIREMRKGKGGHKKFTGKF